MLPLELEKLGADYYVGNCHKWLMAPKGCAFLWTHPSHQSGLHPTTISLGFGQGYLAEFDWIGTRDHSAWLAVTAAMDLRDAIGETWIQSHNRDLAWQGAQLLARAWHCELPAPREMLGSIITLPAPVDLPGTGQAALDLQDRLWDEHGIAVPAFPIRGRLWLRISAQIYNQISDYERLALALAR
jgi:isopenicillin-N epimerase